MAITVRIGNENDFKPAKLLPGEPAASLDTPKFRIGIGSGKYLELATIQELQNILDASQEEYEAFQNFVDYLRENPNAYDAIVAEIDALPEKYVQLTNLTRLTEQNLTLETLNPGNYYALRAVANTFADKPEGVTLNQSYVTVYWDFWTTRKTTKRIELIHRGDGRKWYKSYDGTKWGNWIEYTRNEEIADKTKLTQYTSWADLGLKEGEAGIDDIFSAMSNNSVAILSKTSTTEQGEFPYKWGMLTVTKSERNRSTWEYVLNNAGNVVRRWVGGYSESMEPKWTGWKEIAFATESLNVQTLNSVAKLARMQANTLNDDQAKEVQELYDTWEPGKEYKAGDRVNYIRNLYKVLQNHTSQEGWEPNQAPALFTAITVYDDNLELWTQPSGSTDAYQKGDKVLHNDIEWESTVDNNVWEPGVYGWEQIEN